MCSTNHSIDLGDSSPIESLSDSLKCFKKIRKVLGSKCNLCIYVGQSSQETEKELEENEL